MLHQIQHPGPAPGRVNVVRAKEPRGAKAKLVKRDPHDHQRQEKGRRGQSDKAYMYYQTKHGKPIVGGHVSRPGSETFAYIEEVPLLTSLQSEISQPPGPAVASVAEQMRLLSEANIQYLVLDKDFLSDANEANWKTWLI